MFSASARNTINEELLDLPGIEAAELHQNMAELDVINRLLGGHHATLKGLQHLLTDKAHTYTVVDIGCGGGDMLRVIHHWAKAEKRKVKLIGLDYNTSILDYARAHSPGFDITYLQGDYRQLPDLIEKPDVLITSLFLHHLFEKDALQLLWVLSGYQKVGWIINDLHRHWFAYHSIKWLTALFSNSRLVKHDAPLSVARGFTRSDLTQLMHAAKVQHFEIEWIWAFRWLVIGKNPYAR